ncbi:hypothetical protein [Methylomicrobium lacus]|uniref:hypothetical protein n=1 Tax=Methylomicrobium lacus TaxID=136992 RepID=UPI0035A947DE
MKSLYSHRSFVLVPAVALLSGCALSSSGGIGDTGMTKEVFAHYVEEVFRFQNRMTSEVMMLMDADEGSNLDVIMQSEQHMQEVCRPLNEYVARDIDGLGASLLLQRKVVKTTMDCDHAAHEVETLLNR